MKKITAALALITAVVVLWGCPYKSDVGIDDKPAVKIDNILLGTWHKADFPDDSTELVFTKATPLKYDLKTVVPDGSGGYETDHYEAWFTKLGDRKLISLYSAGSKKYLFGEAGLTGSQLSVKLLSEDITTQQFSTVAEMRKFIEGIYAAGTVKYDGDIDLEGMIKSR
ncbi:hypothetical protein [Ferruginibacter sp.]